MLYLSENSAGLVYYRPNYLTRILHLVSIIVMLSLFLARNKILLKHVYVILARKIINGRNLFRCIKLEELMACREVFQNSRNEFRIGRNKFYDQKK
jgi:hypothetical protein